MKDKIYKLNRPKGFHVLKRALIAFTSIFICSVIVAVPLSIAIYTSSSSTSTPVDTDVKRKTTVDETDTLISEDNEELLEIK